MNKTVKKFNIIDFVIIVIILGCIAGLIVRYNFVERIANAIDNDAVSVNFIAKELSPEVAAAVENGQIFSVSDSGLSLGEINNIKVSDGKSVYADEEGKALLSTDPCVKELRGNFTVKGSVTDDGFLLEGVEYIAPGKELVIQCDEVVLSVIITEIK